MSLRKSARSVRRPGSAPGLRLECLEVREVLVTGRLAAGWRAVLNQLHVAPPVRDHGLTIYLVIP